MTTFEHLIRNCVPAAIALASVGLVSTVASATMVNAIYNSGANVPVTANGYTASGNTINFTLNYAPATGTDLMVVSNTALDFINGTFDNLTQGQPVVLSSGGVTYSFVANYYGGNGNDLVLIWASERAFAWGDNFYGQIGDGTLTTRLLPVGVKATGVLAARTVIATVAGYRHSLALCSDGAVAGWGSNDAGQLGDTTNTNRPVPVTVNAAAGVSALYGKKVVAIAAGWHSLALCSDGTVSAWGYNVRGGLGDNTRYYRSAPVAVSASSGSALYGKTVVGIGAGIYHSLALCSDGTVIAWGDDTYGQLGDNGASGMQSLVPVLVNTGTNSALYGKTVAAIAAGVYHNLALCTDGTLVSWGDNYNGALGDNGASGIQSLVPVKVNTNTGVSALHGKTVVAIAAGGFHSLALCSDGTVAAWGSNENGQLGDSTWSGRLVPVAVNTASGVSALHGKTVVNIAAGLYHSLALCSDGTVVAWGDNGYGELGDNTKTIRNVPVAVNTTQLASGQAFTRVTSGSTSEHSLAVVAAPPASPINATGAQTLSDGSFQFAFTNTAGAFFGVLATTNSALTLSNWTPLDGLTEVTPGQFQFTDPQATNYLYRYYRVRSP